MKKKVFLLLLVVFVLLFAVSCGQSEDTAADSTDEDEEIGVGVVVEPEVVETETAEETETEGTATEGTETYDITAEAATQNTDPLPDSETTEGAVECDMTGKVNMYEVNVRSTASTSGAIVTTLRQYTEVQITATLEAADGNTWAEITSGNNSGWMLLKYIDVDNAGTSVESTVSTPTGTPTAVDGSTPCNRTGSINIYEVNVRESPSSSSALVTTLRSGAKVTVTATIEADGYTWAQISAGWVVLKYIDLDPEETTVETGTGTTEEAAPEVEDEAQTGKINMYEVNVRKGPGTSYDVVTTVREGDKVTVYETKENGDITWGRIGDNQWVSMKYVTLDK